MTVFSGISIFRQDHMDGAICILSILEQLYKLSGLEMPREVRDFKNLDDLKKKLKLWYASPQIDIQKKFRLVTDVMQNKDTLFLVGENHVRVRNAQKIVHDDATFAPEYCVRGDKKSSTKLTVKESIEATIEGIRSGERKYPGTKVDLVGGIDRVNTPERAVELVDIFSNCDRDHIRAIDLVCDEVRDGPEKHVAMYKRAEKVGFADRRCHAAEFVKHRPDNEKKTTEQIEINFEEDLPKRLENLRTALFSLKANFINHGLGLCRDKELMKFVADHNIGISICPANYMESKLISNIETIGIPTMLEAGVPVNLDVDDDLMFASMESVVKMCELTPEQIVQLNQNAETTRRR